MYKTKIMMMTGSSMITVSKPCGKSAEESGGTEDSFASTPRLAVVVVAALAVVAGSAAGSPVVAGASATVSRRRPVALVLSRICHDPEGTTMKGHRRRCCPWRLTHQPDAIGASSLTSLDVNVVPTRIRTWNQGIMSPLL